MKKILALFSLILSVGISAQLPQLYFGDKGTFKILQLTDIHWSNDPMFTNKTSETITTLVKQEQPDLIVLTGDNVNCIPMKSGWENLAKILEKTKTPWTLVFGNHDEEQDYTKTESLNFLKTFPHFFAEKGHVSGVINYSLPIYSPKTKQPAAVLYFLDSGDYTKNPKLGTYTWIRQDQISWYAYESQNYLQKTGKILPSLMFFHIPLPEFSEAAKDPSAIGDKTDGVSSSEVNSGLFATVLEQKNVMGIFCGHDHDNNFIGIHKGVALGYGSKSGSDGYGDLVPGGRMITLTEGQFAFQTYIKNPKEKKYTFSFPAGLSEITPDTKVFKALKVNPKSKGLKFNYYEGTIENTREIAKLKPKKTGITPKINLDAAETEDHFALTFNGYIDIPKTGIYKFYTYSDDGSVLKIDGQTVVDNDGGHSATRKEGQIALEKGFHKIELLYFEDYMGETLEVGMAGLELAEQPLPEEFLFH